MNPRKDILKPLLAAAAKDRGASFDIPYGLEGRVLAEWRGSRLSDALAFDSVTLLRRFLICSLALMAAVGTLHFTISDMNNDIMERVANSALLTSFGQ